MGTTPKALLDRPTRRPDLQIHWDVFRRLSRSRQWTEAGPQSIQISEFASLCDSVLHLKAGPFREDLLDIVQDLDRVFTDHVIEKQKTESAKNAQSDVVKG